MSNCECAGERLNLNQAAFWEAVYASSQVLQVKVFGDETFFLFLPAFSRFIRSVVTSWYEAER